MSEKTDKCAYQHGCAYPDSCDGYTCYHCGWVCPTGGPGVGDVASLDTAKGKLLEASAIRQTAQRMLDKADALERLAREYEEPGDVRA